jgi:hypothetical protein
MLAHFAFAGQFAASVIGYGPGFIPFPDWFGGEGRAGGGQAGEEQQASEFGAALIDGFDEIASAVLVNGVEIGISGGFDAAGAMDDVGNPRQGCRQAGRVFQGARADFDVGEMGLDEAFWGGWPEQ